MATPHYAYNMMKLPGPSGIITVHGDPDMAVECEDKGAELADTIITAETDHAEELAKYVGNINKDDPTILKKPTAANSTFEATTHTRTVELVPGDSSQTVTIGAHMSPA